MSLSAFDPTVPGAMTLLALLSLRVGGVLLVAPVFSATTVPMPIRAAVLIVLTLVLLPAALGTAGEPPVLNAATAATETIVGFAIGLGAAVLIGAAEVAGDMLATQTGLAGSSALDPMTRFPVPTLSQFVHLFALTLLLALDGHLLILQALAMSASIIPIGGAALLEPGLFAMVSLGGELFLIGLRFAAPVMAAVLVSHLSLGLLAKAAPQVNVLMVAFPVQIAIGLFVLALSMPLIATFFVSWPTAYESFVSALVSALTGRP